MGCLALSCLVWHQRSSPWLLLDSGQTQPGSPRTCMTSRHCCPLLSAPFLMTMSFLGHVRQFRSLTVWRRKVKCWAGQWPGDTGSPEPPRASASSACPGHWSLALVPGPYRIWPGAQRGPEAGRGRQDPGQWASGTRNKGSGRWALGTCSRVLEASARPVQPPSVPSMNLCLFSTDHVLPAGHCTGAAGSKHAPRPAAAASPGAAGNADSWAPLHNLLDQKLQRWGQELLSLMGLTQAEVWEPLL